MIDESYREFAATDRQSEVLDAVIKCGSNRKAAELLGVTRRTVDQSINRIKKTAANRGHSPDHDMTHTTPSGFGIKRHSRNYDADGNLRQEWVISTPNAQQQLDDMKAVVESMKDDIPKSPPNTPPITGNEKLCNLFNITDYHLGMNAWGEETGADWDLKIAEDLLVKWFAAAIHGAPQADTAVFHQGGDFLHWDDAQAPITPFSGNVLDGDSRTQKVVRVAIKVLRRVTKMLLESHKHVHIVMAEGNHDPASSIWLREMFAALYEDEPRITVDLSPDPYYCFEFGKTSLFFHHGHKRKIDNIDAVFAAKFREVFGRTVHSYGHMGHLHKKAVIESNLMEITQHRTLASPDSYATRGGWISGRSASHMTYHCEYGFVGSGCITPEMLK